MPSKAFQSRHTGQPLQRVPRHQTTAADTGVVDEKQKRSPISIQEGAGREDRDLWFYWLHQGVVIKVETEGSFRHARNSHRRPVLHFPL